MSYRNHNGFTLVELLLAITILGFVLAITYSSLASILNVKTILEERRETRQEANAILLRLAHEIQLANQSAAVLPPCATPSAPPSASTLDMIGETSQGAQGARRDTIRYMAYEAGQFIPGGDRNSGMVQIEYRTVDTPPEYARPGQRTLALVREEVPNIRPIDEACKKTIRFALSYNLTQLRFDYFDYDRRIWSAEWGNTPQNQELPNIVRITIGFLTSSGKEELYTTSVALTKG